MKKLNIRFACLTSMLVMAAALAVPAKAQSPKVGDPPEAKDMALVGMQRPAGAQRLPADHPSAGRPLDRLYRPPRRHPGVPKPLNPLTGQAEFNGTSLVDVTDPRSPKYLVPYPRRARQLRAGRRADGAGLRRQEPAEGRPGAVYLLRPFGNQAHEIWNTGRSAKPEARRAAERIEGHA